MLLLPPPTNSANELKVKLQTRLASDFGVAYDKIQVWVKWGNERKTRGSKKKKAIES